MRRSVWIVLGLAVSGTLGAYLVATNSRPDPRTLADRGYQLLGKGDYAAAASEFERAIAALAPDDRTFFGARVGLVRACIVPAPDKALADFESLAESHPRAVDALLYRSIATEMHAQDRAKHAYRVLDAGIKRFPENEDLPRVMERLRRAEKDPEALATLKGLGYLDH
jgi:tetratricopeptide (TPR) repeat protein